MNSRSKAFPSYRNFKFAPILKIRLKPRYVPFQWTSPWWTYPRSFRRAYVHTNVSMTFRTEEDRLEHEPIDGEQPLFIPIVPGTSVQKERNLVAAIHQRTRYEILRLYTVPLQIDNGPIYMIHPEETVVYMDQVSLFCLWVYDDQNPSPADFQISGFDSIVGIKTHAGRANLLYNGFDDLRFKNRGMLRNVDLAKCVADVLSDGQPGVPLFPSEFKDELHKCLYLPHVKIIPPGDLPRYHHAALEMIRRYRVMWEVRIWSEFYIFNGFF